MARRLPGLRGGRANNRLTSTASEHDDWARRYRRGAASTSVASRSGVIGSSAMVTPSGASASSTALASAAGAIMRPPSPPPFTPYSVKGEGVSTCPISMRGTSWAVGSR